ncbi:conserved hypothetical protein [Tenacibaculum sp. 190524A02b]|uniref:Lipoprotein n=1 Tax=Tenacibaculum vairaonense TaxID=3137860 RepID=A0ABP1FAS9_9FLAO
MKNLTIIIKTFIVVLLLSSCNKNEPFSTLENSNSTPYSKKKVIKIDTSSAIQHRGIYINGFRDSILGDSIKETYLLNWCNLNKFNEITLYTVNAILNGNNSEEIENLANFINRAHVGYNLDVSFSAVGKEAIENIRDYQTSQSNVLNRADGIFSEYEFWNPNDIDANFKYFDKVLTKTLNKTNRDMGEGWEENIYVKDFTDSGGEYSEKRVITKIVNYLRSGDNNRIGLVNYRSNAQNFPSSSTSSYYQTFEKIADIAAKRKKVTNVIVLFMTREDRTPTLFDYFATAGQNNDFDSAFISFKQGFLNSAIANKQYINLMGYQIYRYSDSKKAKPLP